MVLGSIPTGAGIMLLLFLAAPLVFGVINWEQLWFESLVVFLLNCSFDWLTVRGGRLLVVIVVRWVFNGIWFDS